jgi:acyl-coenzyme A thioesterase PaaI-like protein
MSKPTKQFSIRRMQWLLFLMGLFKIPLIGYVNPKLIEINDEIVKVKIRLRRRTKNHLNSMYFGSLAVGADIAGGIHVFYYSEIMGEKISFSFKGMKAEFLKRAESDVIFESTQGNLLKEGIEESIKSGERVNKTIFVNAIDSKNEIVATFEMIASLKVLSK